MLVGRRYVEFNGLHLPANQALLAARRTSVSIHFWTGDKNWPVANAGSGFLYRLGKRHFCVLSRHQIHSGFSPTQLVIKLTKDPRRLQSGARAISFPSEYHDLEETDLLAVELPWIVRPQDSDVTFYKHTSPANEDELKLERLCAIGFPNGLIKVSGDERCEGTQLSQVLVWGSAAPDVNGLPMLKISESMIMRPLCKGNFDGFSGAPVFGVNEVARTLRFRGIIIRGSHDKLFFTPSQWISKLCSLAFGLPPVEKISLGFKTFSSSSNA